MSKLLPFIRYPGSKHSIIHNYPKPRYDIIIDVGVGSASYPSMYHDKKVIINDINIDLLNVWHFLLNANENDIYNTINNPLHSYWQKWSAYPYYKPKFTWKPGYLTGEKRKYIIKQLPMIKHWCLTNLDYRLIPNIKCTWFIDLPYQKIPRYKGCKINYNQLEQFVLSRRGQVIVCEQKGADWLQFQDLLITKNGSSEVIWTN